MDTFLVDYIKSGTAWVLVGSGPSTQRGYPGWGALAEAAAAAARRDAHGQATRFLDAALDKKDYPEVFQASKAILGGPRLLDALRGEFNQGSSGSDLIYRLLARWPIPVYLTTNYDDELQAALANLGESYLPYGNSPDHLSLLIPGLQGAIVKLHGDLRSEEGLILTTSDYRDIENGAQWQPWRTKLTSIFQMTRVVVIGHSLSDPNIRAVLKAAKQGAGVVQPVCWIAPDVPSDEVRLYLEKYRIRVISYPNHDGTHSALLRVLENVDEFIPPRVAVHMSDAIARVTIPARTGDAGAAGFFVFNKLAKQQDYHAKRTDVVLAALQSALPNLQGAEPFTLEGALAALGWPADVPISPEFAAILKEQGIAQNLFVATETGFRVHPGAETAAAAHRLGFEHARDRFRNSLSLRIKRQYPSLSEAGVKTVVTDIEASLAGYFRVGGLALVSTLFSQRQESSPIPSSILRFITEASARYSDLLKRQAFVDASVGCFARPESADRDYLGRISQGFVAFHMLGAFGAVAAEKLAHAKESVWIIDSSAQIFALALGGPLNSAFAATISSLRSLGVRLYTTASLFDETREHLWFANKVIDTYGPGSAEVISAALGRLPYRKSNAFLEGFIGWRAAGNPSDWQQYLRTIFGIGAPDRQAQEAALARLGIEIVQLQEWPGFDMAQFDEREIYATRICELRDSEVRLGRIKPKDSFAYEKAQPEGEALVIVTHERAGSYNIAKIPPGPKDSWFVSATSVLNLVVKENPRVTWQPDAFVQFASTLAPSGDLHAAERGFEVLLVNVAKSGLTLIDERVVGTVFGGMIEQATLALAEQKQVYRDVIAAKYGESPEAVLARISPSERPLAALQLANQVAAARDEAARVAESQAGAERRRANIAENKLKEVDRYRRRMEKKRGVRQARAKAQRSKGRKKRKHKKKANRKGRK